MIVVKGLLPTIVQFPKYRLTARSKYINGSDYILLMDSFNKIYIYNNYKFYKLIDIY